MNIGNFVKKQRNKIKHLSNGWKGALTSLSITALIISIFMGYNIFKPSGMGAFLVGTMILILATVLFSGVISIVVHIIKKAPTRFIWMTICSFLLISLYFFSGTYVSLLVSLYFVIVIPILGGFLWKQLKGEFKSIKLSKKICVYSINGILTIFLLIISFWVIKDSDSLEKRINLSELKNSKNYDSSIENPIEKGSYSVKIITYGSENNYRKDFQLSDSLKTRTIDGSAFLENWSKLRTSTLGFGPDKMPLNGRVWYPDSNEKHPLIIMVHGNHTMNDYSDEGYGYLGELLASRGYIFVSVDENFLNSSFFEDLLLFHSLKRENQARGMLLLEHVKLFKEWNSSYDNPFSNKVDMNNIALIGHSRGGEAVAIASAFNKMKVHPDNGNVKLDYNFNIRAIVSIAGTDSQYKPLERQLLLEDINFLSIHGSHDMDVFSFQGMMQYDRIQFSGKGDFFKSYVYIYGANHGQFNSTWGRNDLGVIGGMKLFNTNQLISKEDQEQIAKVTISSFLDATLKGKIENRKMFKDLGYAMKWLPDNLYLNNYQDSKTLIVSSFDEDIDISSTTLKSGTISGENLEIWKETKVDFKFGDNEFNSVFLKWDNKEKSASKVPSYIITLPDLETNISESSSIIFSMAENNENERLKEYKDALIDLTISIEDSLGNKASIPLSHFSPLVPMVEGKILKKPFSKSNSKEPIFQYFEFELKDFLHENKSLDITKLKKIGFTFDKIEKGSILIDDIGIR
ncbi:hypothetical protein [Oceanirhabdus seepicola]|uniref:Alpha/beta hydrolase n=1 Tax=Oceanirhabdus seepicola TaxID=2828781 RepID=A0A9J6P2Z3_9CLOT|nr:hypothetical protein [Oceanirhabdus seepicola]MCM1991138.1 hypothetical protein [Oceanirhabdus seepicola]